MHQIYFIQAGERGPIKIGITNNVIKRLNDLQVANYKHLFVRYTIPFDSRLQAETFEKLMHRVHHKQCIRGEWFKPFIDKHFINTYLRFENAPAYRRISMEKHLSDSEISELETLTAARRQVKM